MHFWHLRTCICVFILPTIVAPDVPCLQLQRTLYSVCVLLDCFHCESPLHVKYVFCSIITAFPCFMKTVCRSDGLKDKITTTSPAACRTQSMPWHSQRVCTDRLLWLSSSSSSEAKIACSSCRLRASLVLGWKVHSCKCNNCK